MESDLFKPQCTVTFLLRAITFNPVVIVLFTAINKHGIPRHYTLTVAARRDIPLPKY